MGFRLAREITHLRDRLSKWKEQCASLEMRLSSSETQCQSLQTKLAASEADRQERGQELERARLLRAALDKEKEISERELSTAAALNRDILKAKDDEISHLKAKLVDTKDQVSCRTLSPLSGATTKVINVAEQCFKSSNASRAGSLCFH